MRWLVLLIGVAAVLAGCGGSSKSPSSTLSATTTTANTTAHTYVLKGSRQVDKGIYVTIVSPVAIPTHLMTQQGATIVARAQGPQACSLRKTVHNPTSSSAFLDGKSVTVKINGSSPTASTLCSLVSKAPFDVNRLGGI